MKRVIAFARRNCLEILRDPLTVFFGLLFPLLLMGLLTLLGRRIPADNTAFALPSLAPGAAVFGLSFVSLFAALLFARDRATAFLTRLYTTPMRAGEFLAGYLVPLWGLSLLQQVLVYLAALPLGLGLSAGMLAAVLSGGVCALLNIAIGLLCGAVLSDRQVGGICGALLTNLTAWLSGMWFDVTLLGGTFSRIARALPFYHAVEACRAALQMQTAVWGHLGIVLLWTALLFPLAVFCFMRRMRT